MNIEIKPQPTDFEMLRDYENTLKIISDVMIKYIDFPPEVQIELILFGTPIKLSAKELKEHLNTQMLFVMRKIEEVESRIVASEGKVA